MNAHVPRREVRFELPDPDAPGFREDIARQAALLADAEEEAEVMAWIEANWIEMEREIGGAERAAEPGGPLRLGTERPACGSV